MSLNEPITEDELRQESGRFIAEAVIRQLNADCRMRVSIDDLRWQMAAALMRVVRDAQEVVDLLDALNERSPYDDQAEHRLSDAKEIVSATIALRAAVAHA